MGEQLKLSDTIAGLKLADDEDIRIFNDGVIFQKGFRAYRVGLNDSQKYTISEFLYKARYEINKSLKTKNVTPCHCMSHFNRDIL